MPNLEDLFKYVEKKGYSYCKIRDNDDILESIVLRLKEANIKYNLKISRSLDDKSYDIRYSFEKPYIFGFSMLILYNITYKEVISFLKLVDKNLEKKVKK